MNAGRYAALNKFDRERYLEQQNDPPKVTEVVREHPMNTSIFTLFKEDHTIANLIRHSLLNDPAVLFAGYRVPHPLRPTVDIRITTKKEGEVRLVYLRGSILPLHG